MSGNARGVDKVNRRRPQEQLEAAAVLKHWVHGLTIRKMMPLLEEEFGHSFSTAMVSRRFQFARESIVLPEVEQAVKEHREKLNYLWRCIQPGLQKGSSHAVQQAVGILEREAKLLGLDRPVQAQVTVDVSVTRPIEDELAELAGQLSMASFTKVIDGYVVDPEPDA